ncbi:hypothetical protein B2G69_26000 [Methylorubrum zatmanii]|nr:DUF892 family protein [Methylorubrum zatmanii]ARO57265.1 hypothetical protein B2G69_26000 [Methylorubrum zatmanii]KQQ04631.1 hypothetical protein ASF59_02450 [Methylobacterium sp. Leaf121]
MADDNFTKWHIAGLHALRSASEQGDAAGKALAGKVSNADLKALLGEYSETAGKQETHFVGFLKELGTEPNGFKDRIMEGVGNGTSEMVKAAPDQGLLDLSAVAGTQSGLDYYAGAFKGQGALARQLGYADQADSFMAMSKACEALRERFTKVGDTIRAKAAGEARKAA